MIECLQSAGHTVIACKSFRAAINHIEGAPIALIISDVHLENGGSVFDFLKWVRINASTRETPFVMFSCNQTVRAMHFEDGIRTAARILGATKYIAMKEFDREAFSEQIRDILIKPD